ncbi:hypothetical protein BRADI_1g68757v3 [Brachypodium distachyon]|uniref:Uncharacterized protein n=1 Tax=Brachypodium distachyon TaxID=15368 RepID=A0A2K2DU40_BRADI|nr:hypothetical protein BRADI_1g68757v3 [Brachypodium distachyon]
MAFPSSISYISSVVAVVVLVAATTAVAQTRTSSFPAVDDVTGNATVAAANGTTVKTGCPAAAAVSSAAAANNDYYSNRYICYLCYQRNTMMIKWCPLYKDHCHVACLSSPYSSRRALQPPGPDGRALQVPGSRLPGPEDCYVMKLYPDGSWIIVDVVNCYAVAGCQLVCGYADAIPALRMLGTKSGFPPSSPAAAAAEPNPKRRREGEAEADMREEAVERLRGVVRDSVGKHLYTSAIFLADKVAAATGDPADVYMLAQALFLGRHFRRALHVLNNSRLLRDLRFRYLAAKCLEELKEWHQCLIMLGDAKVDEHGNVVDQDDGSDIYFDKDAEDHEINIKSAICFLRGKAYEALHNRDLARQWYKAAVKVDPLCYEALECLVDNYMLTCEEDGWLSAFYSCLIRKHEKEYVVEAKFKELERESCSISSSSSGQMMKNNIDVLACKAEYYHQSGEYQKCFELTSVLLERDPFHLKCTLVHLAATMELGHSNDLYLLSCNLVKDYPQKALSWFAVGCYYYCIMKYDQARRYFGKATGLEGTFPPAWIGTGIAYAAQEEGDQAMAAFRTAARLFPGCHLPTLYMGMQYVRMHNFKLAEQFFMQAKSICPSDPLIFNELGVVAYNMKEYQNAVQWFELTLDHTSSSLNEMWEPTLVNLGHALRKLKKYEKAISYYEKALTFPIKSLSAFSGLAYCYQLMDNFEAAITYYHKALWLKPDDQFCTDMLTLALETSCQSTARRK